MDWENPRRWCSDEIEKGFGQCVAEFFGGLPGSLTDMVQKPHNLIGCDGFKLPVTEFPIENGKQNFIVFSGAFFFEFARWYSRQQ
ncbi:MAG: hypothetical protein WAM73_06210 [Desulfobacterales bacterium]